jgi:hypothetical protein
VIAAAAQARSYSSRAVELARPGPPMVPTSLLACQSESCRNLSQTGHNVDEILDLRSFQIREKFRGVVDRRKKKCLRQGGVVTNGPPGRQQKSPWCANRRLH